MAGQVKLVKLWDVGPPCQTFSELIRTVGPIVKENLLEIESFELEEGCLQVEKVFEDIELDYAWIVLNLEAAELCSRSQCHGPPGCHVEKFLMGLGKAN